jgi:hypothetical protein
MQFRIMFKDDVEQLRLILASHVTTLNFLLLMQTGTSLSAAQDDRTSSALSLENKILAQRRMLENIDGNVGTSLQQQQRIETSLQAQHLVLVDLDQKAERTGDHLRDQGVLLQETQTMVRQVEATTIALSTTMGELTALAASGMTHLRQIVTMLHTMLQACAALSTDIRSFRTELIGMFCSLRTMLQEIDNKLPARIYSPIIQFSPAVGHTLALPLELCLQWHTFTGLLRVVFHDRPGKARVEMGLYSIMNARGRRRLKEDSWQHSVRANDHLSMSIVVEETMISVPTTRSCSYCYAFLEFIGEEDADSTCPACSRPSLIAALSEEERYENYVRTFGRKLSGGEFRSLMKTREGVKAIELKTHMLLDKLEDLSLYRQIQVRGFSRSKELPLQFSKIIKVISVFRSKEKDKRTF